MEYKHTQVVKPPTFALVYVSIRSRLLTRRYRFNINADYSGHINVFKVSTYMFVDLSNYIETKLRECHKVFIQSVNIFVSTCVNYQNDFRNVIRSLVLNIWEPRTMSELSRLAGYQVQTIYATVNLGKLQIVPTTSARL